MLWNVLVLRILNPDNVKGQTRKDVHSNKYMHTLLAFSTKYLTSQIATNG